MNEAITFGEVFWVFMIIVGVLGLGALLVFILSIFADEFKH